MPTRTLAAFAAGLRLDDVPERVVDRIQCMLLDQHGIAAFVASRTPWGRAVTRYALQHGAGPAVSQVLGTAHRVSAPTAALASGTLAMGFEYEDMHVRGDGHPFAIAAPAALAAGEAAGASGSDVLAGVVAGYEVGVRASYGQDKKAVPWPERGLYPITVFGVFGAAAGAARAMGLDAAATANALGIAGSHAFGTMQAHKEGTMARRLNAGRAAEVGVTAALLAREGFTGPNEILEGEFGIYATYAEGAIDLSAIADRLGEEWASDGVWLKNYPCNGLFQAPLDAYFILQGEHGFSADDVRRVTARIPKATRLHGRPSGVSSVNAQFSLHYCMALALAKGRPRPEMFLEENVRDPRVIAAMERVDVELLTELRSLASDSSRPGQVEVELRDGTVLQEEVLYPKGHPKSPMGWDDVRRKHTELVAEGGEASATSTQRVEDQLRGLGSSPTVPLLGA